MLVNYTPGNCNLREVSSSLSPSPSLLLVGDKWIRVLFLILAVVRAPELAVFCRDVISQAGLAILREISHVTEDQPS